MEMLVYSEADDTFRSGKVMVLAMSGLVPCELEPKEYEHEGKTLMVVCLKEKTWPDALRPYVEKVKAEVFAEANPKQVEIRTILFQPTEGNWACDVYVRGVRVLCGHGFAEAYKAINEATEWISQHPDQIKEQVQP